MLATTFLYLRQIIVRIMALIYFSYHYNKLLLYSSLAATISRVANLLRSLRLQYKETGEEDEIK